MLIATNDLKDKQLAWALASALGKTNMPVTVDGATFASEVVFMSDSNTLFNVRESKEFNPLQDGNLILDLIDQYDITLAKRAKDNWEAIISHRGSDYDLVRHFGNGVDARHAAILAVIKKELGNEVDIPEYLPFPTVKHYGFDLTLKQVKIGEHVSFDYEIGDNGTVHHAPTSYSSIKQATEEGQAHCYGLAVLAHQHTQAVTLPNGDVMGIVACAYPIETGKTHVLMSYSLEEEDLLAGVSALHSALDGNKKFDLNNTTFMLIEPTSWGHNLHVFEYVLENNKFVNCRTTNAMLAKEHKDFEIMLTSLYRLIPDEQLDALTSKSAAPKM